MSNDAPSDIATTGVTLSGTVTLQAPRPTDDEFTRELVRRLNEALTDPDVTIAASALVGTSVRVPNALRDHPTYQVWTEGARVTRSTMIGILNCICGVIPGTHVGRLASKIEPDGSCSGFVVTEDVMNRDDAVIVGTDDADSEAGG